jgi:hypothetical protein
VNDRFKRTYAVEITFDTSIDFAEQDRLACVVLERLVEDYWETAAQGTRQGNIPIEGSVRAYLIEQPQR